MQVGYIEGVWNQPKQNSNAAVCKERNFTLEPKAIDPLNEGSFILKCARKKASSPYDSPSYREYIAIPKDSSDGGSPWY